MRRAPRTRTPRHVEVLGLRFDVVHYDRTTDITGDYSNGLLGQCAPDSNVIRLAHTSAGEPVGADGFTDTLLHECLHALVAVIRLQDSFKDDDDEAFIKRFSPVLLDFIRRNKSLVAWLQRRD